jgi:hypothetical protein
MRNCLCLEGLTESQPDERFKRFRDGTWGVTPGPAVVTEGGHHDTKRRHEREVRWASPAPSRLPLDFPRVVLVFYSSKEQKCREDCPQIFANHFLQCSFGMDEYSDIVNLSSLSFCSDTKTMLIVVIRKSSPFAQKPFRSLACCLPLLISPTQSPSPTSAVGVLTPLSFGMLPKSPRPFN